jgi:hypothetical protein
LDNKREDDHNKNATTPITITPTLSNGLTTHTTLNIINAHVHKVETTTKVQTAGKIIKNKTAVNAINIKTTHNIKVVTNIKIRNNTHHHKLTKSTKTTLTKNIKVRQDDQVHQDHHPDPTAEIETHHKFSATDVTISDT